MKTWKFSQTLAAIVIFCQFSLYAQTVTNGAANPVEHKPRPLTDWEANQVRSRGLDPTGMTIQADLPTNRQLTAEELGNLEKQGIDAAAYKGKTVTLASDGELAALEQLINNAKQRQAPSSPSSTKGAYIWMDTFMGMTNASIVADLISAKPESLRFELDGKVYDYSGHYTVMLDKPRKHKAPYLGLGSPEIVGLVMLENFGGEQACLTNATIWEKGKRFINVEALGKEWIYSGVYTTQKNP